MAPKLLLIWLSTLITILPATHASERVGPRDNDGNNAQITVGAYDAYRITMPLDHFNKEETRTFQSRFFMNDTYYKPGGPVFLKPAGETPVYEDLIKSFLAPPSGRSSALTSLAAEFDGLAIILEHRYYGQSQAFEYDKDTGVLFDPKNYKFLTLEQSLEDIVFLSTHLSSAIPEWGSRGGSLDPGTTPWVMIGGSHAGVQSAVMRVRNPEIVYASWVSSAPVESQPDMSSMGKALQRAMPANCSADIHGAISFIDEALGGSNQTARDLVGASLWLAVQAKNQDQVTETNVTNALKTIEKISLDLLSRYMDGWRSSFQSRGLQDIWLFCDSIEMFNPEQIEEIGKYYANFNNPGDAEPTAEGLAATWGIEVAANAFISALWKRQVDLVEDDPLPDPVGNPPRYRYNPSWTWQRLSEFGNWWVGNASDPLSLKSIHTTVDGSKIYDARIINVSVPEDAPNTDSYNKYGGWAMNPSHVMFTDGTWDSWMARSVLASSEVGGPGRTVSSDIPSCNSAPSDNGVFGLIYQGAGHGDDLTISRGKMRGFNYTGYPMDEGLPLFINALHQWLPCFASHASAPTDQSAQNGSGKSTISTITGRSKLWILAWSLLWSILEAIGL